MKKTLSATRKAVLIFLAVMLLTGSLSLPQAATSTRQALAALPGYAVSMHDNPQDDPRVLMPTVLRVSPWRTPFGVELAHRITSTGSILYTRALDLPVGWARLNGRISWRALQPNEGDPINWALLAGFEAELRALRSARITPVVIVSDYPRWANDETVRWDGQPTSCARLNVDHYDEFAVFMQALVNRYKTGEYNVHIWELGNEPDVDPDLVPADSQFGCWGDIDSDNYGGGVYGNMLRVVTPAIKAADPSAQVWIGGLLLAQPVPSNPDLGHPELFLQGILQSGSAAFFDAIPYHSYPGYNGVRMDQDAGDWAAWGGYLVGKARFLRQIMAPFGVDKPLYIDEVGMNCSWCTEPLQDRFLQMQADFLVRSYSRALNENISALMWYTLDGPGWHYSGLLDSNQNPKPVYYAHQQYITRVERSKPLGPVSYGTGIEAYAFGRGGMVTHVIYTITDTAITISLPQNEFIAAYTRDGAVITPGLSGSDYTFQVTFEPIYLIRTR